MRPPLPPFPIAEQVAINVKQAIAIGTDQIQIQLKPASLGAIDVKLNVGHDGRVTAVISTDRSDTLNLLKQDSSGLQQALRNAGLQADNGSLSFNLRSDGQAYQQGSPQGGGGGGGGRARMNFAVDVPSIGVAAPITRRHAGNLDIHV
jgi:flagellar hook-length control protein FliK